jgi:uncharacterized membrane protein HdeD (DUF308 family)
MVKTWKVGRHLLLWHGGLMLCLGIALFCLVGFMANPIHDESGYTMAVVLAALCLLIACVCYVMQENRARRRAFIALYLLVGSVSIACWSIFWMVQSPPLDIPLLVLLAGLHGLFWGLWYLRLAFHFRAYPKKAVVLCILAGTTSSLGIVLSTRSQPTNLSAVTAVACYTMFIGVQILLTAPYLYYSFPKLRFVESVRLIFEDIAVSFRRLRQATR